ncbi:MAG TPA: efflux RND transporter permease subunit [Gemmataceae bacterium]|jgi:multidrug efflux pump subunit AcrB
MNGLIRASLNNKYAVTVFVLTIVTIGLIAAAALPVDILPPFKSPAVQVLTFYGGMPAAAVENDITNRMERWTGQAAGTARQESRSIVGASIVRNFYRDDIDPNGALTQVNSLASAAIPNLPPGTLPPVILPFDPTGTTPVCIVALDSKTQPESILYDTGRYEVRNMIMGVPGAVAPVVYGGKLRAVLAYLDRARLQARNLSPQEVMNAIDSYNVFLPTGAAKLGKYDYALDSNSMYEFVDRMGDIPVKTENGKTIFLRDVADPKDASLVQTNIVRVNGRRQVYIPVYRQMGTSTLNVVDGLKAGVPDMKNKLTQPDIDLKVVMDQSVYVRHSIASLVEEGVLGAILCSVVILLFLGEWRMTVIALLTIPVSVLAALTCLYVTGNTLNVMTLAGLSLAIGPLVDIAIICLENTHRHLGLGVRPSEAAYVGASEVSLPALVASCCTLLVLAPLALMPGMGAFLFRPMAFGVAFCMLAAFLLAMTFVPAMCALWLRGHGPQPAVHHGPDYQHRSKHEHGWGPMGLAARAFARWESAVNIGITVYVHLLHRVMRVRLLTVAAAVGLLVATVLGLGTRLKREFFPEVDAGAFEVYVRASSGTRLEETEKRVAAVENAVRNRIGDDLELVISEIGLVADWSAAYTPNAGPMDAVLKVQLKHDRHASAQEYVQQLREGFAADRAFADLEFAFDAGGMIRGAMNEGKSTPINVRVTGKNQEKAYRVADAIRREVRQVNGVVDCRILQRLDYPEFVVEVDQAKAADLGLTQVDVMKNLVAAVNSSIQYNKKNFWIDPVSHNQYYVGVQYPESDIESVDTLLDVPITSPAQKRSIPLRNVATVRRATVPAEVNHTNLQATIDLTMGVQGRDLGHVADDVYAVVGKFGEAKGRGQWVPYDPASADKKPLAGSTILLSGEYTRMQDTFRNLGIGLVLASLLIYFLMVALFKSWLTPLVILFAVPIGLVGVITVLYVTGTALNVQSLLGVIFMVGIVVSNTVLMVDFAQQLRHQGGLTPTEAIVKSASVRVRPVVMTALAAFFALVPMALGLARGSEANTPLGRAVIGGLVAGLVTTLFVVPALFSLVVRDGKPAAPADEPRPAGAVQSGGAPA